MLDVGSTSPKTSMAMENHIFLTGNTSSNCCFSIVMLVFPGCIDWVYHPTGAFVKKTSESMMWISSCFWVETRTSSNKNLKNLFHPLSLGRWQCVTQKNQPPNSTGYLLNFGISTKMCLVWLCLKKAMSLLALCFSSSVIIPTNVPLSSLQNWSRDILIYWKYTIFEVFNQCPKLFCCRLLFNVTKSL